MPIQPTIRPARWPDDEAQLHELDTSYITPTIYRVRQDALSFNLDAEMVNPPIYKTYGSAIREGERVRQMDYVAVAELDGALIGIVAADLSEWNRRVQIERMYIAPRFRGQGVGRALMDSAIAFARSIGSWCVWLETQNINYPAVQFYQRCGFKLCGMDTHLYDVATQTLDETALYFALDLTT